ncbi:putative quinol monooxygenase [Tomitella gaofuii]|uniref:putative quinol monooxygenase n=1 Tax=Tomitella gaofuii TaxID=2760083 RepID=UPI0015FBBCC3|nr:putative quinol monooxygenase [Tomitella gaofuii]
MPQVKVVATMEAKDGAGAEVERVLTGLAGKSRAENGCVSYEVFASTAAPGTFVTIETWADEGALDAHMRGLNLKFAASALREHLAGSPALHPLRPVEA